MLSGLLTLAAGIVGVFAVVIIISKYSSRGLEGELKEHPQYAIYLGAIRAVQKAGYTTIIDQNEDVRVAFVKRGIATYAEVSYAAAGAKIAAQMRANMFLEKLDEVTDPEMRSFVREHGVNALVFESRGGGVIVSISGLAKDIDDILPEWLVIAGVVKDVLEG
jgi:hypothetical protein